MGSEPPAGPPLVDDRAERVARVRAMLAGWAPETVSHEPDWSIEDIEPLRVEGDVR